MPGLPEARLVLMHEVQSVIRNGLGMLGISAPDRM
ncbi:MAG: DALR anticodon-binding domain-containing protein [Nitrospirota bacterium]|nr:DALR anticodon-binding domain-containing protein [Nitrospirota bacterium]